MVLAAQQPETELVLGCIGRERVVQVRERRKLACSSCFWFSRVMYEAIALAYSCLEYCER